MAAYARTPSALTWLHVNYLINGLHKQISCKNCLFTVNSYFTISVESRFSLYVGKHYKTRDETIQYAYVLNCHITMKQTKW